MPVLQFRIMNYELRIIFNTSVVIFNNCHAFFVFTYQIEKMHFGMYILDCHVASLLAMSRTHPRAYQVLLCKTCGNDGGWTWFLGGDFKGLAP